MGELSEIRLDDPLVRPPETTHTNTSTALQKNSKPLKHKDQVAANTAEKKPKLHESADGRQANTSTSKSSTKRHGSAKSKSDVKEDAGKAPVPPSSKTQAVKNKPINKAVLMDNSSGSNTTKSVPQKNTRPQQKNHPVSVKKNVSKNKQPNVLAHNKTNNMVRGNEKGSVEKAEGEASKEGGLDNLKQLADSAEVLQTQLMHLITESDNMSLNSYNISDFSIPLSKSSKAAPMNLSETHNSNGQIEVVDALTREVMSARKEMEEVEAKLNAAMKKQKTSK